MSMARVKCQKQKVGLSRLKTEAYANIFCSRHRKKVLCYPLQQSYLTSDEQENVFGEN